MKRIARRRTLREWLLEANRFADRQVTLGVKSIFAVSCATYLLYVLLCSFQPVDRIRWFILTFTCLNPLVQSMEHGGPTFPFSVLFAWEYVTRLFVYLNGWQLLFNMVMLWLFAPDLEDRWGGSRFARFFLTVGVWSGILHQLIGYSFPVQEIPVSGASGVIFGLMFAYAAYHPNRIAVLLGAFPVKVIVLVPLIMVGEIVWLAGPSNDISHLEHFTGLAVAYIYLAKYNRTWYPQRWRYIA